MVFFDLNVILRLCQYMRVWAERYAYYDFWIIHISYHIYIDTYIRICIYIYTYIHTYIYIYILDMCLASPGVNDTMSLAQVIGLFNRGLFSGICPQHSHGLRPAIRRYAMEKGERQTLIWRTDDTVCWLIFLLVLANAYSHKSQFHRVADFCISR